MSSPHLILAATLTQAVLGLGGAAERPATTFAACRELLARAPDDPESSRCFVDVARRERDWSGGRRMLRDLLAVDRTSAGAHLALAELDADRGGDGVLTHAWRAAELFARSGSASGEVLARYVLVDELCARSRIEEAGLQAAQAAAVDGDAQPARTWSRLALARADSCGGLQSAAWAHLREAENHLPADATPRLQIEVHHLRATLEQSQEQTEAARSSFGKALALARSSGDAYTAAALAYNLAFLDANRLAERSQDRSQALEPMRRALRDAIATGNLRAELRCHIVLGQGSTDGEALEHFGRAIELADRLHAFDRAQQAQRFYAYTLAAAAPVQSGEVLDRLDAVIGQAREVGNLEQTIRGLIGRASLTWILGDEERALASAREAFDAIEQSRSLQAQPEVRARWHSRYAFLYRRFSGWLLQRAVEGQHPQIDLERAIAIAERLRARVFLDSVSAAPSRSSTAVPVTEGRPLPVPDVSLGAIRGHLKANEALFTVQLADVTKVGRTDHYEGGSWLVAITCNDFWIRALPEESDLLAAVTIANGLLERTDPSAASSANARLGRLLFRDVLGRLPETVDRLVVVLEPSLESLPLAALTMPDGSPFPSRFAVARFPSIATFLRSRERAWPASTSATLAIVDPGAVPVGDDQGGTANQPLPFARRQGRALLRKMGGGTMRAGRRASEAELARTDLSEYSILHFGAHAVVDQDHPERSAIVLADSEDRSDDGFLHPDELGDLGLDGQLVVLAACRSASGAAIAGEGVMGLARAFLLSGARTVVASLWPLRDDVGALLFSRFYDHLAGGATTSEALRRAQSELREEGVPARAWAGVVVMGDGTWALSAPAKSLRSPLWAALLAAALVLALSMVLIRIRHGASALRRDPSADSQLQD